MLRMGMVIGTVNILTFFCSLCSFIKAITEMRRWLIYSIVTTFFLFPYHRVLRLASAKYKNVQAFKIFFVLCMGKKASLQCTPMTRMEFLISQERWKLYVYCARKFPFSLRCDLFLMAIWCDHVQHNCRRRHRHGGARRWKEREVNAADDRLFNQLISSTFPSFFFAYQAN